MFKTYIEVFHSLHIFSRCPARVLIGVAQLATLEELGCLVPVVASSGRCDLFDQLRWNLAVANVLHHREMFKIIVGLEKCITSEELDYDASYAPYVAGEAPAKLQDDLWRSIMSRGHD